MYDQAYWFAVFAFRLSRLVLIRALWAQFTYVNGESSVFYENCRSCARWTFDTHSRCTVGHIFSSFAKSIRFQDSYLTTYKNKKWRRKFLVYNDYNEQ